MGRNDYNKFTQHFQRNIWRQNIMWQLKSFKGFYLCSPATKQEKMKACLFAGKNDLVYDVIDENYHKRIQYRVPKEKLNEFLNYCL